MGDRANVKITYDDSTVFLYTHWCGSELPTIVQKAMQKKWRWTDGPYLARIIFCEMLTHDGSDGETGFGISSILGDGEDRILHVNVDRQTIQLTGGALVSFADYTDRALKPSWPED